MTPYVGVAVIVMGLADLVFTRQIAASWNRRILHWESLRARKVLVHVARVWAVAFVIAGIILLRLG